jgi:AbrB family looped-hinge helix DNA binding protein
MSLGQALNSYSLRIVRASRRHHRQPGNQDIAMLEITAKISSKNQIALPADIRRRLGVGASDSVAFVVGEDGKIEVRVPLFDLESVIGSVPPLPGASLDFDRDRGGDRGGNRSLGQA